MNVAKREVEKLLRAVDLMDEDPRHLEQRVVTLEDERDWLRQENWRLRQAYDGLKGLLVAACGDDPDIERIDSIMRIWTNRACTCSAENEWADPAFRDRVAA